MWEVVLFVVMSLGWVGLGAMIVWTRRAYLADQKQPAPEVTTFPVTRDVPVKRSKDAWGETALAYRAFVKTSASRPNTVYESTAKALRLDPDAVDTTPPPFAWPA